MTRLRVNLSDELRGFSDAIRTAHPKLLEQADRIVAEEVADMLSEDHMRQAQAQQSPSGRAWRRISPLTMAIRRVQGIDTDRLAWGPRYAMLNSLRKGGRGHVRKISKRRVEWGSKLKKKGYLVVQTFQTRYQIGKTSQAVSNIQGWAADLMGGWIPTSAFPLLHHARQLVGWSDKRRRMAVQITVRIYTRFIQNLLEQSGKATPSRTQG